MIDVKAVLLKKFKPYPTGYKRFKHSEGVYKEALSLVDFYNFNVDREKLYLAAMLHDYAKFETFETYKNIIEEKNISEDFLKENPKILHALLGHYVVEKELNISDAEVLSAICFHTTGKENMTLLEELIFLADFIEENRKGKYFEDIKKVAYIDFKKAIALELELLIKKLTIKSSEVNQNTLKAYNYYKKFI